MTDAPQRWDAPELGVRTFRMVVLYFEIRCRKEAFEIEHLARLVQASSGAPPPALS